MNNMTQYERFSVERKQLQRNEKAPNWYTTSGYQLLKQKNYLLPGETPEGMYIRIADRASHIANEILRIPLPPTWGYSSWNDAFYSIMWNGWMSPSTPVLTNMGNNRGHPIACSGGIIPDSIAGFYRYYREVAQLTQRGYGTSAALDLIRPRGESISKGGEASGVHPVMDDLVTVCKKVSQGNSRRGSIGKYLDILSADFDEVADQILADDDGWNVGWNITDDFLELIKKDVEEADRRWKKALRIKLIKGKGYFLFLDKVNRTNPKWYTDKGYKVHSSNLCSEIALTATEDQSFTCVLASMNVAKYDEWKDTKATEIATVFLDTVIEDMLIKAKQEVGFEKVIKFTEGWRAIGLGLMGEATYFQEHSLVFGDLQTVMLNKLIVKQLNERTHEVSKWLANEIGEPEFLKGYGERFSHRIAIAPTMSTAIIMGGVSDGINPIIANSYEQDTAGGTVYRINPTLLNLMKERGVYNKNTMKRIAEDQGSVQAEDWLSQHEKDVFRTAFEINQETILKLASDRQQEIDQSQSVNLFFTHDVKEEYVSEIHMKALLDPYIKSLYYIRTLNGATKVKVEVPVCEACNG